MGYLLQMAGFPGTGKSTLSTYIAKHFDAVVLDRDIIKNSMLESGIEGESLAKASYKVVYDLASHLLGLGKNVIIDTPCYYQESVDNGLEIANRTNVDYRYIECIVNDFSIVEKRLRDRDSLATQIVGATKEVYLNCYNKSVKPIGIEHLSLETSNIYGIDLKIIREYLLEGSTSKVSSMYIR